MKTVPAKDVHHGAVRRALEKEGWRITHDPLSLTLGRDALLVDLAATRTIAAERGEDRIAVEVKSFTAPSLINEFHAALGQYMNYRLVLDRANDDRALYLAIPADAHRRIQRRDLAREAIIAYNVAFLVYNPVEEVILEWNPRPRSSTS